MPFIYSFILFFLVCINVHADVTNYLKSIQSDPNALYTFFKTMPKGGELHYHLSGSTYAENMLPYAAQGKYCLDLETYTMNAYTDTCDGITSKQLMQNQKQYDAVIRAWSMKDFDFKHQLGHDHFFAVFGKQATLQSDFTAPFLADIIRHAAAQHILYLEIMNSNLNQEAYFAEKIKTARTLADKKRILLANLEFQKTIRDMEQDSNALLTNAHQILNCDKKPEQAVCQLTVKFQFYVKREQPIDQIFAQALAGFAIANQSQNIVGINIVQPEDGILSTRDYAKHMQIFNFLHQQYPNVHIALHAGELAPGLVAPETLSFHIHDAVFVGQAERIGHGVDIKHEQDQAHLLRVMAEKPVVVEINLSSNKAILSISSKDHSLPYYLKHHIPVVLSTDDEGILRTDLTQQYVDAVHTYHLDYPTIKQINRNALTYSFLPGASLWADPVNSIRIQKCQNLNSPRCKQWLRHNEKARIQSRLEHELEKFEMQFNKQ